MTRADALTTGTETADAVVIGAGHNGLVAANLLADQGWSVRVLEASDKPGGATRTEEGITAPGYLSDLGNFGDAKAAEEGNRRVHMRVMQPGD